jgi:hypothetical protein
MKTIFGVDGSPGARAVLRVATSIAKEIGPRLVARQQLVADPTLGQLTTLGGFR